MIRNNVFLQRENKSRFFSQIFLCILFIASVFNDVKSQQIISNRNYLTSELNKTGYSLSFEDLVVWRAKTKEKYLRKISDLPDSIKLSLVNKADKALLFNWPVLPAITFLEYKQTGNRINYENKLNERRHALNALVIGELITGSKRYLPQIVNGLWVTLEESTWEIPAIVSIQKTGRDLPDPSEQIIGLVSAETGVMMALVQNMLAEQLDGYSPVICKRIAYELNKRMIEPYLQRDDFWWMGLKGQRVNNWNAWINTNILQVMLWSSSKEDQLSLLMPKLFKSTDQFINQYPADGGCDEGTSYWNIAGGKLIRFLELVNNVSSGKLSWASNKLLHNIGSYIYKMQIADSYFVNFADASNKFIPNPESVYKFGEMFNDDTLRHFGSYLFFLKKNEVPADYIADFLETAVVFTQLTKTSPEVNLPHVSFLPDLQVLTARYSSQTLSRLFLAVQGGNNGESHNHNDVGNFLIYANGKPVIVDAGVGTYTAQTFSSTRYELWNMQSQWHNCPVINGVMQKDGAEYKASDVMFEEKEHTVKISMDISKAYPAEALIKKWNRKFLFNQNENNIIVTEDYQFEKRAGVTSLNFLTSCEMKVSKKGLVEFYDTEGKAVLNLKYNTAIMQATIEEKDMDDDKLINAWGKKLFRLLLKMNDKNLKGKTVIEFSSPVVN